tara:strand:- start:191 stop:496 length:306 start_codon:yes stop_codon:yes gene_type:complete
MAVHLTAAAATQIVKRGRHVLFHCRAGGCNGMEYVLEPCTPHVKEAEPVSFGPGTLYVCNKSIFHVLGTTIDWREDIMGARFVFDNPNAQSMCGCGATFST